MAFPQLEPSAGVLQLTLPDSSRERLLSPPALEFLADLHLLFEPERQQLLNDRRLQQTRFDAGQPPGFLDATASLRTDDWQVAPLPRELCDRRVEITGPVDRKTVINGLNSGARVFMADFEDSHAPGWDATLAGHQNLVDALRGDIEYRGPQGRRYQLQERRALLMVRPRGWHLQEKHVLVDGQRMSAALFDFGLFLHSARPYLGQSGQRPLFYLPKLEHHLEAALWARVFRYAERVLALPPGLLRATILIETVPAVFQMHEILYQLRDYAVALNCGRWDYLLSYIKVFRSDPSRVLPERSALNMTAPFLRAYSRLLIETCHRRGALAIGGMAAQIPVRGDAQATQHARELVRQDKLREAGDGHDGTWVAHPGLIETACSVFDRHMPGPNQLAVHPDPAGIIDAGTLLAPPTGRISHAGLVNDIEVALEYLYAWLGGSGCVPIHHLMEDAATAEIARAQLWQWAEHGALLDDGRPVTRKLLVTRINAAVLRMLRAVPADGARRLQSAGALLMDAVRARRLPDFITLAAYEQLA